MESVPRDPCEEREWVDGIDGMDRHKYEGVQGIGIYFHLRGCFGVGCYSERNSAIYNFATQERSSRQPL